MEPLLPNLGCWFIWPQQGTGKIRLPLKASLKSGGMDSEVAGASPPISFLQWVVPGPPSVVQHRFLENTGRKRILRNRQHTVSLVYRRAPAHCELADLGV